MTWKKYRRRFREPLLTGAGKFSVRSGIVFRMKLPDGTARFGEIAPWPGFNCETLDEAEQCLRQGILPRSSTLPPCTASAFAMAALSAVPYPAAPLRVAALLSTTTPLASLAIKRALGFSTFKLKINANDPALAESILEKLLTGEQLRLDANASLNSLDPWLEILADRRVEFLEQPFPHARMTRHELAPLSCEILQKLALDESAVHAASLPDDWPGILIIKPLLLGDWDAFRHWRQTHIKTPVVYSSCFETAVGREAILRLAAEDINAPTMAHGLDTLSLIEPDFWRAHPDEASASMLHWSQDKWEKWWEHTSVPIIKSP